MKFRFVFRTAEGTEVQVPAAGDLARHVDRGDVREDTPLFDAISGEWSPAREHPVFRLIREELGIPPEDAPAPHSAESPGREPPPPHLGDVAVAPVPELETDMVREFLEARERERREEGLQVEGREGEVSLVDPGQATLAGPGSQRRGAGAPPPRVSAPRGRGRRRVPGPGRASRVRTALMRWAVVVALAGAAWAVVEWRPGGVGTAPGPSESVGMDAPPRPAGPLVGALDYAEPDAFRDMATGMEALRARVRLGDPPAVWMSGAYLADAGRYPEVAGYWRRYLEFLDSLRADDETLFREGLLARLEGVGLQGRVLAVRTARELQDFRADSSGRVERYGAMSSLADAALSLHELLEEHARTLRYVGVEPQGASESEPAAREALDEAARARIWAEVEALLGALDRVAGPDARRSAEVTREVATILGSPAQGG